MEKPMRSTASFCLAFLLTSTAVSGDGPTRARDLGVPFDGAPGTLNAITDVAGVEVGQVTLISGEGTLQRGKGPVRTGVTAILPRGRKYDPVFAGWHSLNGNRVAGREPPLRAAARRAGHLLGVADRRRNLRRRPQRHQRLSRHA
jgi:hypothetical protein